MRYCFDFYVRLTDLLEAKSGNLQWENLENLSLKQIANLLKKKNNFCYFNVQSKKYILYCNNVLFTSSLMCLKEKCMLEK